MNKRNIIKGLLALFLFTTYSYANLSTLDELIKNNDIETINKLVKSTKIIENDTQLPDNPKENELIIIENEYDIKVLFEFFNGEWSEKGGKLIADALNDQKSTYMHLFNYKVSNKDFNPYVSDKESVKVSNEDQKVKLKILTSKFNDKAMNSAIKLFTEKQLVPAEDIINVQIVNIRQEGNETNCDIIFIYKE